MKKSSALIIVASLMLTACGSLAQYASSDNGQQYQDGIYNNTPAFRTRGEKEASKSETQALVEQTKESPIYLFGDKKDTVMIPQDMSATIRYDQKLGGTVVTVGENPYDFSSSWYMGGFYSPWHSWGYSPWRYSRWYDPYRYGSWYYTGWYDPFYYGSWYYDPWYYAGWYDPWYYDRYYYHHYHHGWYDPYWDHHHGGHKPDNNRYFGSRHETGSDRVFTSATSLRSGVSNRTAVSRSDRNSTVAAGSATRTDRILPGRSTAVKTKPASRKAELSSPARVSGSLATAAKPSNPSLGRAGSASRPAAPAVSGSSGVSRPTSSVSRPASQSNHRRPATVTGGTVTRESYSTGSGSSFRGSSSTSGRQSFGSGSPSRSSYSSGSSSSSRSSYSGGSSSSSGRSSFTGRR